MNTKRDVAVSTALIPYRKGHRAMPPALRKRYDAVRSAEQLERQLARKRAQAETKAYWAARRAELVRIHNIYADASEMRTAASDEFEMKAFTKLNRGDFDARDPADMRAFKSFRTQLQREAKKANREDLREKLKALETERFEAECQALADAAAEARRLAAPATPKTTKGRAHSRAAAKHRANGNMRKAEQHEIAAQLEG